MRISAAGSDGGTAAQSRAERAGELLLGVGVRSGRPPGDEPVGPDEDGACRAGAVGGLEPAGRVGHFRPDSVRVYGYAEGVARGA